MTSLACLQTLPMLARTLDRYFARQDQACASLAQWLRLQAHPMQIHTLIQDLLRSPQRMSEVAAHSYQHGNGFLKVVLINRGYKLRLHIWFPGSSCEENLHDHRWSFASTILTGTLYSEIWRDAQPEEPADLLTPEYTYYAATGDLPADKKLLGQCRLIREGQIAHTAGSAYHLPEQVLHRILNPGDELVATLMCTAPTQQGTTRLIPLQAGMDPEVQPPRITPQQLHHALQNFLHLYLQEQRHDF